MTAKVNHTRYRSGPAEQRYLVPSGDEVPKPLPDIISGRIIWPAPPIGQSYERETFKKDIGEEIKNIVIEWLNKRNWQLDVGPVARANYDPTVDKTGSDPDGIKSETSIDAILNKRFTKPRGASRT